MSLKHTGQNVGDNTDDTNEGPVSTDGTKVTGVSKILSDKQIQDHSRASSSGWPVIEDYMSRHDHRMVKDVADDIDTLLVFVSSVYYLSYVIVLIRCRLVYFPLY